MKIPTIKGSWIDLEIYSLLLDIEGENWPKELNDDQFGIAEQLYAEHMQWDRDGDKA